MVFTGGQMSHWRNYFQSNLMEQDWRLHQSSNPFLGMASHMLPLLLQGKWKKKKKKKGGRVNPAKLYFLVKAFQNAIFPYPLCNYLPETQNTAIMRIWTAKGLGLFILHKKQSI